MDFTIPDPIRRLTGRVREYVGAELYPLEPDFLTAGYFAVLPRVEAKRALVRHLGLWAPHAPVDAGGQGLSLLEFAFVAEELGRSPLGHYVFNCQAPDAGNMEILHKYGTEQQKQFYLRPLVAVLGSLKSTSWTMT
jgi:alkylation response protein AidB-like acyl-CoA dehydrogenase